MCYFTQFNSKNKIIPKQINNEFAMIELVSLSKDTN